MAVQVNPITQSLPATTAIQDPATRRFAQAVEDALRALRSEEGAVESLKKAADAMNNAVAGGTPPSIAQWLFSSELYQKLTTEIARVDTQAKQDVLDEALARSQAIQEIQAALAEIESTPAYDPATTYQIGDLVTYDNKLYRAKVETTGNLPTNTTYWDKVGDYASLGDVVAAHTLQLSEIESDITDIGGDLAAEITARDTLATQLRGTYTGTDVAMVSQGLLYSERQARVTADGVTVSNLNALRAQVGVTEAGALTEGFILDEQTIRNTNDLAIVSAVNTALAQITGVSTSISQSGQNLIANWTQAQATKWSQIESEVLTAGGQTIRAALAQESNTRSTLAGQVSSTWMVRAQIDSGTGKPYIAGIALGAEGQNGGATSEFIVQADKFVMTMPGLGGYVPFAIGPTGAEFTGLTNWSNVQGATKPQDGATRNVFRGAWTTSTAYVLGDIVLKDGNGWSCLVAHTAASGNQPPSSGGGNTWWTLYAVKGADGANAIVAVLSNESHVIPTDSAGNNGNYSGAATTITIYNGTSNDSANWTVTATTSNVSGSLSGKTYTVSGLSADTGYVDLTATRSGYASVVKRFVLSKSKAGTAGAQGPAVVVTSSRATTFTATDGVLDGSQADIVLTASVSGVTSPTYAWTFSGLQSNPVASTTNTQTITAAQFGTAKSATVTCTVNGAYKDQVTLVRLEKSTAAAGANQTYIDAYGKIRGVSSGDGVSVNNLDVFPLLAEAGSNLVPDYNVSEHALWEPHQVAGYEFSPSNFVTISDGKIGNKAFRRSSNSLLYCWGYNKQAVPLVANRSYVGEFWSRKTEDAGGSWYVTVRLLKADGTVNATDGSGGYAYATVAAPGTVWTLLQGSFSSAWVAARLAAGTVAVRPGFALAHNTTLPSGAWAEAQGFRFFDNTVEAATTAANALLADIAADSKLTPAEKKSVRKEWDAIYAERAGIRAQADSFGITTEKTNYDNDFQALGTYLNGGTAYTLGATPPSWITDANLATTTTIVGATFRANWSNLYANRQALLNKISAEAAKKADWSTITGSGKPENGATKNTIYRQSTTPSGATNGDIWIDTSLTPSVEKILVSGAWQVAATVGATFNTGQAGSITGQITQSNVTTWIDNAALGNAQIGGNLWSTNWNYAGGSGWLLDRSGNFYGNNIYARGDIEASSLKANTAMVDTLHINGNAVTVPVTYTSSATVALTFNAWTTIGSAYINPEGAVVFVHAFAQFSNSASSDSPMYLRVVSPSGQVITAANRPVTSTIDWGTGTSTRAGSISLSGAFSETGTYTIQLHPGAFSGHTAHHRALLLIAGKR